VDFHLSPKDNVISYLSTALVDAGTKDCKGCTLEAVGVLVSGEAAWVSFPLK